MKILNLIGAFMTNEQEKTIVSQNSESGLFDEPSSSKLGEQNTDLNKFTDLEAGLSPEPSSSELGLSPQDADNRYKDFLAIIAKAVGYTESLSYSAGAGLATGTKIAVATKNVPLGVAIGIASFITNVFFTKDIADLNERVLKAAISSDATNQSKLFAALKLASVLAVGYATATFDKEASKEALEVIGASDLVKNIVALPLITAGATSIYGDSVNNFFGEASENLKKILGEKKVADLAYGIAVIAIIAAKLYGVEQALFKNETKALESITNVACLAVLGALGVNSSINARNIVAEKFSSYAQQVDAKPDLEMGSLGSSSSASAAAAQIQTSSSQKALYATALAFTATNAIGNAALVPNAMSQIASGLYSFMVCTPFAMDGIDGIYKAQPSTTLAKASAKEARPADLANIV